MAGLDPRTLLRTWEEGRGQGPLERSLTLLAALAGTSTAEASRVDVGTRDVRLAGLLTTAGDGLVWACAPCGGCGGLLDVALDPRTITACPVHPPGTTVHARTGLGTLQVRLPTTADLQAVAGHDPSSAREALLDRCLVDHPAAASAEVAEAVDAAIEEVSPAVAVELEARCPDCATVTVTILDVPALVWAEVDARARALLREVHALAVGYGWTEDEVLALPARRRAAYTQMAAT